MKPLLKIFDISKNEQRVVLIVMLFLVAMGFVGYERRTHHSSVPVTSVRESKPSPSPMKAGDQ